MIVSLLLHACAGVALWKDGPDLDPEMAIAAGKDTPRVAVRFLSSEQYEAMVNPEAENLVDTPTVKLQPKSIWEPSAIVAWKPTEPADVMLDKPSPPSLSASPRVAPLKPPMAKPPMSMEEQPNERVTEIPERVQESPESSQPTSDTQAGVDREPEVVDLPRPTYPMLSRRLGEQGLVVLSATVGINGHAHQIQIEQHPGHDRLVEAAKAALRAARFTPAQRNGQPVAYRITVPFRFQLDD